jgi:hypothetical protein
MQSATFILLADVGDILQNIAPVIFVVLYGIAHLVGNLQQEKKKAPRPQPVEPAKDFGMAGPAKPAPAGNQPTLEETLRREVEEFLRKAQGGQPQQPNRPQPQPGPQRQRQPQAGNKRPSLPRDRRQPERPSQAPEQPRRLVESQRPEPAAPVTPLTESRPLNAPTPLGTGVALHSQTLVNHAQSLGAKVALADERMQEHLNQKFSHQLGSLATATPSERRAAAMAGSHAQQLRAMLAGPESVRQLIIASEILRRPEERWQ